MSELKRLVNQRKYIRKCVTEHFNRKDTFPTLASSTREKLRLQFEQWLPELKDLNKQILGLKYEEWEDEEEERRSEEELASCQDYNDKLLSCLVAIRNPSEPSPSVSHLNDPLSSARSLLKSPIAPLPKYTSSDDEDLARFFEEFEDTLSKFRYPEYDKLLLLKHQISGRALVLVESLEADKQGYSHAKQLLLKALASDDTQKFNVLRQLSHLKLSSNTDPYEFICKVRLIMERVCKLKMTVDCILQFFIWEGLNDSFKNHLIQITNSSKPTLNEIVDKFFEASERYCSQSKKTKEIIKLSSPKASNATDHGATSLAVDVKYERDKAFKPCSICTKVDGKLADHPIHKCAKFDSAEAKIDKIRNSKGCIKCSNLNHQSKFCRYRFKNRCKYCSEWHFSFLCIRSVDDKQVTNKGVSKPDNHSATDKGKDKAKSKPRENKEISGSMVNIMEAFQSDSDMQSVLPTFTSTLDNGLKLRCLKDSGCQCNFILTDIADRYSLPTLRENISLTVNGINTTQNYTTKLVEVRLQIGDKLRKIEALCMPSINVKLKLPKLGKVVSGFKERGYLLADESLSNNSCDIQSIQLILGTRSAYCLPQQEHLFGSTLESLYSETPAGVLLHGNVEQILKDLSFLPYVGSCFQGLVQLSDHNLVDSIFGTNNTCLVSDYDFKDTVDPVNINVFDDKGEIIESQLIKAANKILEESCHRFVKSEPDDSDSGSSEINKKLVKFALEDMKRDKEGRIVVPLLWNSQVSHLLGSNQGLAVSILKSNLKKLQNNRNKLLLMDKVFKEQESMGIIERINNLPEFLREHPNHSFLLHMGIFKMDRETTKCRIVYLSNLCQQDSSKPSISHNQAIYSGPNLNQKLSSAILHLRFGQKLLCFDLCKAFNNLALSDTDSNRLLWLWFRNVEKEDFTVVGYRNIRLSFGLRCSPALLLLALYKILILEVEGDDNKLLQLKKMIYQLCFMDNCAAAYDSSEDLLWAYQQLESIFEPYKFYLQQYISNDAALQDHIDSKLSTETNGKVKLLGLSWDRKQDSLSTKPISLNIQAQTKREVLQSIASQYDLFNFNGPLLNRSRLFLHQLQCDKDLGWDQELNADVGRQWWNIAKQANAASVTEIQRVFGSREETYRLLAFSDSSKQMFGVVIYMQNISTGKVSFVFAKNRIVNKQLESKSMPSLELQGITLAVEEIICLYEELSGSSCMMPIKICELIIYLDSFVALSWVHGFSAKLDKMQKCSVFVQNRLHTINELCNKHPIHFSFVSGCENPADCITRSLSFKQLQKTNYFSGPKFLLNETECQLNRESILDFVIPALPVEQDSPVGFVQSYHGTITTEIDEHTDALSRCSSYHKVVSVFRRVLIFVNNLKMKLKLKDPVKFEHISCFDINHNFFADATKLVIRRDQRKHFPEMFEFFESRNRLLKDIPKLVGQLNVYVDQEGLLRVRSKMQKLKDDRRMRFPLLISKDSLLTKYIVLDYHERFSHAGCYRLLAEVRKIFWIPRFFFSC